MLFLITFITSIPAYFFYVPVLDDPRYILGAGADTTAPIPECPLERSWSCS